ncbi:Exported hypothetical protein [Micromonospora lupini str. Lupac 08]|uniref:Uncharacterized protein n=1 Tax=Micromonospora lupini str. Lupac 08 TaxID=1150864 RepID=I0KVY2_9ACTN|nr:Exported hypothetical protein [Micromonospora lupini str. Lupac 08]
MARSRSAGRRGSSAGVVASSTISSSVVAVVLRRPKAVPVVVSTVVTMGWSSPRMPVDQGDRRNPMRCRQDHNHGPCRRVMSFRCWRARYPKV